MAKSKSTSAELKDENLINKEDVVTNVTDTPKEEIEVEETLDIEVDDVELIDSSSDDFGETKIIEDSEADPATEFYKAFFNSFDKASKDIDFGDFITKRISGGKKTIYNKTVRENRVFDDHYIIQLENGYQAITKILRDPKKSIRYEEDVVAVEKARKVNAMTIRHLTSHTQLIKKIEDNGDVIPSKVLTQFAEEELAIYENRFIKTLILRVDKFLERRYDIIKENLESFQSDRIKVTNNFKMDGKEVGITMDVVVRKEITESVKKAQDIFDRISYLRDQYRGLKSTDFMKELAKARIVTPPIMKTNILLHNADFKIAYALWLYLDRYDGLGYDVSIKERSHEYTKLLSGDIDSIMATAFTTALHHRRIGQFDIKAGSYREYLQKRPKYEAHPDNELSFKPGNYELEKNVINEYFLQETSKYFKNSLKSQQRDGTGENQSLRIVYRQMLEIIDNIYPSVFDIRETQIEDNEEPLSLEEQLEIVQRRQKVLKIVREQKELNIAKMEKQEERAIKDIIQIENKLALQRAKQAQKDQRERERQLRLENAVREREEAKKAREEELIKKREEAQKQKEKALIERQKQKEKEEEKKAKSREKAKALAAEKREKMKTSKRRNIRPRKRSTI